VGLVVIDYLQLVQPADAREPRQEQVAGISRRLKLLARELAVPVVVMAQVNRAAEEHGRPQLRHLRESGAVEQDSDTVLLLHAEPGDEGRVVVDVAKQRNGPTGEVPVTFLRQYQRFENHAGVTP
jgi:replicative DNA helicase